MTETDTAFSLIFLAHLLFRMLELVVFEVVAT